MKCLSLFLALFLSVSSGCHSYNSRWCDEISKLDCNTAPHNVAVYLCGSDGITYNSRCAFNKAVCEKKVKMDYLGKCAQEGKFEKFVCDYTDHIICHGINPICGTDHVTYDNGCELVKAHCKNKDIVEAHTGFCAPITTPEPVTMDPFCKAQMLKPCHGVDPICGTDGVIYDNSCEFEKKKCTDPTIRIKKLGAC